MENANNQVNLHNSILRLLLVDISNRFDNEYLVGLFNSASETAVNEQTNLFTYLISGISN